MNGSSGHRRDQFKGDSRARCWRSSEHNTAGSGRRCLWRPGQRTAGLLENRRCFPTVKTQFQAFGTPQPLLMSGRWFISILLTRAENCFAYLASC
jgi:hypothetical protein